MLGTRKIAQTAVDLWVGPSEIFAADTRANLHQLQPLEVGQMEASKHLAVAVEVLASVEQAETWLAGLAAQIECCVQASRRITLILKDLSEHQIWMDAVVKTFPERPQLALSEGDV